MTEGIKRAGKVLYSESAHEGKVVSPDDPSDNRSLGRDRRVMLYSHDTFGLGHLQRCLKIARALVSTHTDLSILLVTGSPVVHRFDLPERVDYVKLPAVRKVGPEQYEARNLRASYTRILELRTTLLLDTVRRFEPHLLLVDHSPHGMKGEMLPALRWLSQSKVDCTTVLGLRDIIDDPSTVTELWNREGVYGSLESLYDRIIVYGSSQVFDLTSEYQFPRKIANKTVYCHYICDQTEIASSDESAGNAHREKPLVTVTIGGGDGAGEMVIGSYLEMLEQFGNNLHVQTVIITGPFIERELFDKLSAIGKNLPVTLRRFVPNTREYFARSALVIATGGYNTVTEIISTARRAVLIPRSMYRKEQLMRARRFAQLGLVDLIEPSEVSPKRLFEVVSSTLLSDEEPLCEAREIGRIPLDGARRVAELCGNLLWQDKPQEARHGG